MRPLFPIVVALLLAACGTAATPGPDAGDTTPDAGEASPDAGEATPDAGDETPDAGDPIAEQVFGGALSYDVHVPAGSFERSNTEQNGRPLNVQYTATFPGDSLGRFEQYDTAGFAGPDGLGAYGFHLKSSHVFQEGDTEGNRVEIAVGGFLGVVIPGVTYEFSAWLRNPGSAGWAGPGPDLGFTVAGTPQRTSISVSTLPAGEWKRTSVTYTGLEADAGKSLGVLVGIHGNAPAADQPSPELWIDGLVVRVTTAQSIALENGDFAAPAVTGATETLPTGWTLVSRTNVADIVGLVRGPGADLIDDVGGRQFLRIDNAYVMQAGGTDVPTVVESGVVAKVVPGKRYVLFVSFREYGTFGWAGNGPKLALKVGGQVTGVETSIIGIKGWGTNDVGALVVAGPFTEGQRGADVTLQLAVWGHAYVTPAGHPAISASALAFGVQ